jgi:glycosyltransferase involved in cell wall biosynthesis
MSVTLSIVIPVYNGASFIAETVKACLHQTYRDFEVIVVNDGSKDGTEAELAQFGDTIRVISIPNGGVSNARNVGVRASLGQYVAFLDADDIWYPDKLERHLGAMLKYPEVGFSCSNYRVRYQSVDATVHFDQFKGDPQLTFDRPIDGDTVFQVLIRCNFVGTCSNVIARRDLLEAAGLFDTTLRQAEDYDLWLRCALRSPFLVLSDILLVKVTHDTNLTNNLVETWQYHEKVLVMLLESDAIKARPNLRKSVHHELSVVRYIIGNRLFNRGQSRDCFGYFVAGLRSQWSVGNVVAFAGHFSRKFSRLVLETLKLRKPYRNY